MVQPYLGRVGRGRIADRSRIFTSSSLVLDLTCVALPGPLLQVMSTWYKTLECIWVAPLGPPLRFFSGMVMAAYCAAHLVRMSWARRLIDIGALTSGINGFTYCGGIYQSLFSGLHVQWLHGHRWRQWLHVQWWYSLNWLHNSTWLTSSFISISTPKQY